MARMHSRKRGRSGSTRPPRKTHEWLSYEKKEVETLIHKLAKDGHTHAEIGMILRDQYGVPDVRAFGLRVGAAAKTKKAVPEDLYNLIEQAVQLHAHLADNHKDAKAIHGLQLVESKVRRLGKYYIRKGRLPAGWKYTIESAKLIVK